MLIKERHAHESPLENHHAVRHRGRWALLRFIVRGSTRSLSLLLLPLSFGYFLGKEQRQMASGNEQ